MTHKTVPIEPTREMILAGYDAYENTYSSKHVKISAAYKAMLFAAPPDNTVQDLRGKVAELVEALEHSRKCLEVANMCGAINDTLWAGKAETLFDYMDAAIAKAKEMKK